MADEHLDRLIALPRVSLVIGDADRRARVADPLSRAGVEVTSAPDIDAAGTSAPDLVVVDIAAGDTVADAVRDLLERGSPPTLVVAETPEIGVAALEAGAADYVVEPFDDRELAARVLLRSGGASVSEIIYGELRIDRSGRRVYVDGAEVEVTPREYALLEYLAVRPRRVFTRDQLLGAVWGASSEWQDVTTVTEHVYRLRQKIESDPNQPQWIITVRGSGYRFGA